jgi:hypothetical protein
MMEVGPYRVTEDGNLKYNNGSWDEFANLLFIDQPVGTGFSYVNTDSYLSELDQMAEHMIIFLEKWFALFPEYEHDDVSSRPERLPAKASTDHNSSTLLENHTQASTSRTLLAQSSSATSRLADGRGHSRGCSLAMAGSRRWISTSPTSHSPTRAA